MWNWDADTKVIREGLFGPHIVSYSRPSLVIIASRTQFHVYLPWGQRFAYCLNSVFKPGEGPSRGLLCDCENRRMVCSSSNNVTILECNTAQQQRHQQLGSELSEKMEFQLNPRSQFIVMLSRTEQVLTPPQPWCFSTQFYFLIILSSHQFNDDVE